MGEIKSTLDLVMEKTRNLKLSDEEKQAQKQSEVASRIKGLLQKLQDGLIPESQFQVEYKQLKTEFGQSDDSPLIDEIFSRLDPDADTGIFLNILSTCCHFETALINSMIEDYRETYQAAARMRSQQLKEYLAQKHSITGTAVVPNLDADEEWQQQLQDMRKQFEKQLSHLRVGFKGGAP
jgi:hypothetical protein